MLEERLTDTRLHDITQASAAPLPMIPTKRRSYARNLETGVPSTMQLETFPFVTWALSERKSPVILWRARWVDYTAQR